MNLLKYFSVFNYAAAIIRSHKGGRVLKVYYLFSGEKGLDDIIQNIH